MARMVGKCESALKTNLRNKCLTLAVTIALICSHRVAPAMSQGITIYHNPRCSKSRQTLALLEAQGIEPTIVRYLDTPPNANELKKLLNALGIKAQDLLRKNEELYKTLNLGSSALSENSIIDTMVKHPILIERPIVVKGKRAVLGRPPENILELL